MSRNGEKLLAALLDRPEEEAKEIVAQWMAKTDCNENLLIERRDEIAKGDVDHDDEDRQEFDA